MVFERKVFRKIFDPTKERDATWRIKTNGELYELRRHKNTINHIKTQILSWFGHLQRMPQERVVKKVYKWKPMLTLILPRSRMGTVWFYTSTSNKRAARPKLYTKSLTRDLKLMYSRLILVRISINL